LSEVKYSNLVIKTAGWWQWFSCIRWLELSSTKVIIWWRWTWSLEWQHS